VTYNVNAFFKYGHLIVNVRAA